METGHTITIRPRPCSSNKEIDTREYVALFRGNRSKGTRREIPGTGISAGSGGRDGTDTPSDPQVTPGARVARGPNDPPSSLGFGATPNP
ncbi:hypothetical protein GCM10026982_47890 [Nocardiopsis aegyptia]